MKQVLISAHSHKTVQTNVTLKDCVLVVGKRCLNLFIKKRRNLSCVLNERRNQCVLNEWIELSSAKPLPANVIVDIESQYTLNTRGAQTASGVLFHLKLKSVMKWTSFQNNHINIFYLYFLYFLYFYILSIK